MRYEVKNQIYSLDDKLAANTLVVGFKNKVTNEQLLTNLESIKQKVTILDSKLAKTDSDEYYFDESASGFDYKIEECENINKWITTQYETPLNLFDGEFLRLAMNNENTLIIFAHTIISDSRGLLNFAKALLTSAENYEFEYIDFEQKKLNFFAKMMVSKLNNISDEGYKEPHYEKIRLKKISLKSNAIYSLCSGNGVSLLSFFLTVALSLSKSVRKTIYIPFCKKVDENILLNNGSSLIKFKRGLEPRLSFWENCRQIDKLFASFLKSRPYLMRDAIINQIPQQMKAKPFNNDKYFKYLLADMIFDALPSMDEDELITTISYYPSSSFINNSFGISIIDNKITICTVLHDEESQQLFSDYQKTINLVSKNSDLAIK